MSTRTVASGWETEGASPLIVAGVASVDGAVAAGGAEELAWVGVGSRWAEVDGKFRRAKLGGVHWTTSMLSRGVRIGEE